jgi:hypothetical protein
MAVGSNQAMNVQGMLGRFVDASRRPQADFNFVQKQRDKTQAANVNMADPDSLERYASYLRQQGQVEQANAMMQRADALRKSKTDAEVAARTATINSVLGSLAMRRDALREQGKSTAQIDNKIMEKALEFGVNPRDYLGDSELPEKQFQEADGNAYSFNPITGQAELIAGKSKERNPFLMRNVPQDIRNFYEPQSLVDAETQNDPSLLKLKKNADGDNFSAILQINNTIRNIDEAIEGSKNFLADGFIGMLGAATGLLTTAVDQEAALDAIKSQLGMEMIKELKKLGGGSTGLGQVSNLELQALQSTIATLNINMSGEEVRQNLKQIRDRMEILRALAVGGDVAQLDIWDSDTAKAAGYHKDPRQPETLFFKIERTGGDIFYEYVDKKGFQKVEDN